MKVDLGDLTQGNKYKKQSFNAVAVLSNLERYMRYEKRFAELTINRIMTRSKKLISSYGVVKPSIEDARRIEDDLRSKGVKNITIKHYLESLEILAESMGIELKVKKPKLVYTQPEFLKNDEALALLYGSANIRDRAVIGVLLYCGLRNKELCALNIEDVDIKNRVLYIRDHGEGIKNYHERKAIMTAKCADYVKEWLEIRPKIDNPALFLTLEGTRLSKDRVNRIVRDTAKRAKIGKRVYTHMLRHTCATIMLRSGIPITDVMLQLGHRSLASTMIYLHSDLDNLKESIDKKFLY